MIALIGIICELFFKPYEIVTLIYDASMPHCGHFFL